MYGIVYMQNVGVNPKIGVFPPKSYNASATIFTVTVFL